MMMLAAEPSASDQAAGLACCALVALAVLGVVLLQVYIIVLIVKALRKYTRGGPGSKAKRP